MSNPRPDRSTPCPWTMRVTEYLRVELNELDQGRFERHLESCRECDGELAGLAKVMERLLEAEVRLSESDPWQLSRERSESIIAGLDRVERVHARPAVLLWPQISRRWAAAAAVVLLAALGIYFGMLRRPAGDRPPVRVTETAASRSTPVSREAGAALARAHAWLRSNQRVDGGWDPDEWKGDGRYRVSLSALVLLALENDASAAARSARVKGVRYLLERQNENGLFGEVFRGALYNHGLATLAVLRGYAEASEYVSRDAVTKAVDFLVAAQMTSSAGREGEPPDRRGTRKIAAGAWGYLVNDTVIASESISFWALRSLIEARRLGSEDGDDMNESIERGLEWLAASSAIDRDSGGRNVYHYRGRGGHTCCRDARGVYAALSLLLRDEVGLTGRESPRRLYRAVDRLLRGPWPNLESLSFYEMYLYSRAVAYADSSSGRVSHETGLLDRREAAYEVLLARQVVQGPLGGSWEPSDRWGHVGGRLYATAVAALTLRAGR